eukprot:TRINITY_DN4656_c0_g1_i2.p1 TRINITY_DN4656_c0_g1~~TRINITY_DN4656_c0_g1_i2.p1  ORF type:complete len:453 (+),score=74.58 TRINITY_DN4656_c0_g1_i2:134-1360(+)
MTDHGILAQNRDLIEHRSVDGTLILEFDKPEGSLRHISFKKENYYIITDYSISVLPAKDPPNVTTLATKTPHSLSCCGLDTIKHNSQTLLAAGDLSGKVHLWAVDNCAKEPDYMYNLEVCSGVRSLCWKGEDDDNPVSLLIGCMNGVIYRWFPLTDPINKHIYIALPRAVTSIKWQNGDPATSLVASADSGGTLAIYEKARGEDFLRLRSGILAHRPSLGNKQDSKFGSLQQYAEIWSLCWSPDNHYIATCSEDQTCKIWKLNILSRSEFTYCLYSIDIPIEWLTLSGHALAVTCVSWEKTNIGEVLITASDDKTIRLYDATNWELLHIFTTEGTSGWHTITYATLESEGNRLFAVTENGHMLSWDLESKELLFNKRIHIGSIEGLAYCKPFLTTVSADCCAAFHILE